MKPYLHKVQYYETDKMGVTHHSNYVRFMEEARVDFLDQIGYGFGRMEEEGMISPVVSVNVRYVKPTSFGDLIEIAVHVLEITAAKMRIGYQMTCNGQIVCQAESLHCFVNENSHPISLKRTNPTLFNLLLSLVDSE